MSRSKALILLLSCLPLAGCGLGETAVTAAAGGASEVQQAREAKATEERFKQRLEDATRAAAQQHEADQAAASQ
jgi:hypothetical protein